jgi:hypothetical protein
MTPLDEHLTASRRRSKLRGIGLVVLLGVYLVACLASRQLSVIIAGGLVLFVATLLAERSRRADVRETNRLMDEDIVREFGPWKKP